MTRGLDSREQFTIQGVGLSNISLKSFGNVRVIFGLLFWVVSAASVCTLVRSASCVIDAEYH